MFLRRALQGVLPEGELRRLGGYEVIGRVAILRLPEDLLHRGRLVAGALLRRGGIETVVLWKGTEGEMRVPRVEVLAGDGTETVHRENGCLFKLDVAKVLFCVGNLYERMRLPRLVREGEVVVDLFAGVGQFSVPIAKHSNPARVYSIELNPVAYGYLCENVRMNRVGHKITPLLGNCREVAPRGVADRVILGLLHFSHLYLPLAFEVLKPDGGVIHYHESVPCRLGFERPVERIREAAGGRSVRILGRRVVKSYAPGVDHVVIDAEVRPN
ncbi:MAG: class I SAM-dependent methyltransferase family protein [Candidatus Hadarchaeales archaeon]